MSGSEVIKVIDNGFKAVSDGSNQSDQLATPLRVAQVFMQNFSSHVCGQPAGIALSVAIPLVLATGAIRVYDHHKKQKEAHTYTRLAKRLQPVDTIKDNDKLVINEETDTSFAMETIESSSYLKNLERLTELKKRLANAEKDNLEDAKKQKLTTLLDVIENKIKHDEKNAKDNFDEILSNQMGESAKKYQIEIDQVTKQFVLKKKPLIEVAPDNIAPNLPNDESQQPNSESNKPNFFLRLVKNVRESIVGKVVRTIWTTLASYSMFYWLTFMVANLAFGLTVAATSIAVLAIPAVIPVGYFIWKLGMTIYERYHQSKKTTEEQKADQDKLKENEEEQKIMKALIQRAFIEKEQQAIQAQFEKSRAQTQTFINPFGLQLQPLQPAQPAEDTRILSSPGSGQPPKKKPNIRERLTGSKLGNALRVGFAAVTGLIGGYVIAQFVAWPITTILSFSPIIAATLASPVGIIALFAVTAAIGVFFAVKEASKARTEQVEMNHMADIKLKEKNNESCLQELEKDIAAGQEAIKSTKKNLNSELDRYCNFYNKNHKLELNKINRNDWIPDYNIASIENKRYFEEQQHKSTKFTLFKKGLNRVLSFTNGAGTGMFVVRSLLLAGGIVSLFFAPPIWVIFGIGLAAAATWGIAKLVDYHLQRNVANRKAMIEGLDVRIDYLQKKKEELKEYDELLKENHNKLKHLNTAIQKELAKPECANSENSQSISAILSNPDVPQALQPSSSSNVISYR